MTKLDEIYHFAQVNERLATAGQPQKEQFVAIKEAGFELIINLADGTSEHDVPEEESIARDLGMDYHNIPVDWENPTEDDLYQFFDLMDANKEKSIFVHCIANFRVSAFTMLYRVIRLGVPLDEAKAFKETIWKPEYAYPVWDALIEKTLDKHAGGDE